MISSDVLRGYNDTMILSLLLDGDSYGYEISRNIRQRSGGLYTMKETTLYSAVARMEKSGYIASYHGGELAKRRTYYTITQAGRDYYHAKCEEWRQTKRLISQFIKGVDGNE